jgi:hypothetical protein
MRLYRPLSLKHPAIRRRLGHRRNPTRAPKGYTAKGVKVTIPELGAGVIEKQVFGGVQAQFRVKLASPIPFEDFYRPSGWEEVMKRYDWPWKAPARTGDPVKDFALEKLRRDDSLVERGGKYYVTTTQVSWSRLEVPQSSLKKGQPIELVDTKGRDHAVRFVKSLGRDRSMLVWFPEPMTFIDIEDLIDLTAVHPSHISKDAYFMPFDGYKKLYKLGIKMPPARRKKYGRMHMMEFAEPQPLKSMAGLLRAYHKLLTKEEPDLPVKSVWFTLMKTVLFHMAPIRYDSISHIRPMREDLFYGLVVPAEVAMEGL